jgi:hypothetical protein
MGASPVTFYDRVSKYRLAVAALLCVGALSGCTLVPSVNDLPAAPVTIGGTIFGGQQPIAGATVQVWAVGSAGYGSPSTMLATTTSDVGGNFSFAAGAYTCPQANTPIYLTATGGDPGVGANNSAIALAAPVGTCSNAANAFVNINEVTTIATAYAYGHFFPALDGTAASDSIGSPTTGSGTLVYPAGLLNAFATASTLATISSGTAPGGATGATVEVAKVNHLANILAACVNTSSPASTQCSTLFAAATPGSGIPPIDTLQAAVSIATNPSAAVATLYGLTPSDTPFEPALSVQPTDWTLAVNYQIPANAASYNMAADAQGNVWFATTGTPGLYAMTPGGVVNGPYLASYLQDPTGIAIDTGGNVYVTDDVAGKVLEYSSGGIESVLASTGDAYSAPIVDASNDLYVVDGGSGGGLLTQIVTGLGNVLNALLGGMTTHANTTSLAADPSGDFFVTSYTGGNFVTYQETPYVIIPGLIQGYNESVVSTTTAGASPWSSAIDHSGDLYSPVPGNNAIAVSGGGPAYTQGGLNQPVAVAVDGAGTIWASNSAVNANGLFSVSQLTNNGSGVSPATGYQHNGMGTPAGITLDGSGNVWVANTTTPVLTEIVGAAAPVVTPTALALANHAVGVTP